MSSSFSAPYNITITNDSPTITYFPYRDGPASGGWNFTCANSIDLAWIPGSFCVGQSSHTTTYVGASLLIEFEGTAAYLYGQTVGSFVVQLDDQVNTYPSASDASVTLLAKSEGLAFGKHRLFLNVTQLATLSFWEAVLTVGVGNEINAAYNLRNRTLAPFTQTGDGLTAPNPQFTFTGPWGINGPGAIGATGNVAYPRQGTAQAGAYVNFKLDNTSAFFVYGLVNYDHGPFSVTLTPPYELGSPVTNFYNSSAHWISLDRVLYWASGMDRDKEYSVTITNLGQGNLWWDWSHIDIIDAESISGGSGSSGKHHKISAGIIGGVIAGAVIIILSLVAGFLCYRKGGRLKPAATGTNLTGQPEVQTTQLNHPAPPPLLTESQFPLRQSYQCPSELVAPTWDEVGPTGPVSFNENVLGLQTEGRPFVQEEDAGTLPATGDNVVRLPPHYKEAWSQGHQ